jgi:hypothetical protein
MSKIKSSVSPENAPRIVPNGTTPLLCAPVGTSVVNTLLTATTKQVTWGRAPFPQWSAKNSRLTLPRFAGRTPPPPRPDFPGWGFAMPGPKKSLPTIPHMPHGRQLHVVHRSVPIKFPQAILPTPTTTTLSSVGDTMALSPRPSPTGSLPTTTALHLLPPVQQRYFDQRE